ncbi:proteasome-type protease, partial [Pantoea sp. 18069]|uniref:proteasome-type protease n=1 Tax=Pantoea sp. 18069 TaxID=2681415 RepID=UPI0027D24468
MTYCVAIKLDAGLVFLADSRTNAGLDHISSFRKMMVYESPGDRFMVLLSAGNLSISQSVREILQLQQLRDESTGEMLTIWNARSMFDAARILGAAVRHVYDRDGVALKRAGLDFNVSLVLGGQIRGEGMRLFQVYSAGNFIEATHETPYFQVGESKYGKPVLDRVITPQTPLDEAAKCALISMDSTIKSNLSVGLPLDLIVYEADQFASDKIVCIDESNPYYRLLHDSWGERLRHVFDSIEDPAWDGGATNAPIRVASRRCHPLHKITPATVAAQPAPAAPAGLRQTGIYSAAASLHPPAHLPIAPVHPDHLMAGESDPANPPP